MIYKCFHDEWKKNYEDLVIIKFWPRSYTQTLAENLKID